VQHDEQIEDAKSVPLLATQPDGTPIQSAGCAPHGFSPFRAHAFRKVPMLWSVGVRESILPHMGTEGRDRPDRHPKWQQEWMPDWMPDWQCEPDRMPDWQLKRASQSKP